MTLLSVCGVCHRIASAVCRPRAARESTPSDEVVRRLLDDSETQYHIILGELCDRYGKKYSKDLEERNIGGTDREICENVVRALGLKVSPAQLEKEMHEMSRKKLSQAPLQKGVERLLTHLYNAGILFALATNSTRRVVRMHVSAKPKVFGLFHHMVCATDPDVDRGKPHPDIYLTAAAKFPDNPKPAKCLVFEDSIVGLQAGVAAGMQVVMTPQRRLPPKYSKKATLVLKSLEDFKPEYFGLPPFDDDYRKGRAV